MLAIHISGIAPYLRYFMERIQRPGTLSGTTGFAPMTTVLATINGKFSSKYWTGASAAFKKTNTEQAMNEKIFPRYALALVLGAVILAPVRVGAVSPGNPAPDIAGAPWINSKPLTTGELRGRVVMVEFWTYG
jgi:hypothetical protein